MLVSFLPHGMSGGLSANQVLLAALSLIEYPGIEVEVCYRSHRFGSISVFNGSALRMLPKSPGRR